MALINPHINFNGNAEEAFTFYKSVFGGEFTKMIRLKESILRTQPGMFSIDCQEQAWDCHHDEQKHSGYNGL